MSLDALYRGSLENDTYVQGDLAGPILLEEVAILHPKICLLIYRHHFGRCLDPFGCCGGACKSWDTVSTVMKSCTII